MKALVVDDSRATRFMLGKMLKEIGYEIVEAENGQCALESLEANQWAYYQLEKNGGNQVMIQIKVRGNKSNLIFAL